MQRYQTYLVSRSHGHRYSKSLWEQGSACLAEAPLSAIGSKPVPPFAATSKPRYVLTMHVSRHEKTAGASLFRQIALGQRKGVKYFNATHGLVCMLCMYARPRHVESHAASCTSLVLMQFEESWHAIRACTDYCTCIVCHHLGCIADVIDLTHVC